jgi:two-component system phosphate regulon sensor histidine kinase PhoR
MADGVIAVDRQARVVIYNGAAMNILNRNDSIEGKHLGTIFHPIDKEGHPIDVKSLIGGAVVPTTNRDLRLEYDDGSIINLYVSIAPVRLGFGTSGLRGYVILLRDITREKSLEEERDEFISVASHELRTPIAITEGNISNAQFIAERGGDPAKIKQALEEAHNQVLFLAQLVNDLSTLSRAERGKLALDIEPIDVQALINDILRDYEKEAAAKKLQMTTNVEGAIPPLSSSKLYVREILQNFLTNALKYTEKGSIVISAKPVENGVQFTVADTGIGISRSDQARVFQKFFRSEDFRTRKTSGTGLGLYVTSKLAHLLHATIHMESELNKGSSFSVSVPNLETGHRKK